MTDSQVVLESRQGILILSISGEITLETEIPIKNALGGQTLQKGNRLFIDLEKTSYINSTGIKILIELISQYEEMGVTVALVRPVEQVRKILALVGLEETLTIYRSMAEAIR